MVRGVEGTDWFGMDGSLGYGLASRIVRVLKGLVSQ